MSSPFSLFFNTPASTRPRKPYNKKPKPRLPKKPQRGMGVERLERLRLQELHKNNQHDRLGLYNYPFNLNADPIPVSEPIQSYPVHYGLPVYRGNCGSGVLGWEQNNVGLKRLENSGFGLDDRVVGSGQVLLGNNQCSVDDYIKNASTITELSSVPNVFVSNINHHQPSYCDLCKKKLLMINGDRSLGRKGRKSNFSSLQISPPNPSDFLGLNLDINNFNFNTKKTTGSFNTSRPARNASYTNYNTSKGKDVVAVHRKGNTYGGGGSVLMEYEFFPRSKTSEMSYGSITSTGFKEWEFLGSSQAKVAVGSGYGGGGEASSCITVCDYTTLHTSNSIDLSLKLSC